MGLIGADEVTVTEHIIKRRQWEDLAGHERRICIHMRPSRTSQNEVVREQVIQVDCHVPAKEELVSLQVQSRVYQLLHKAPVNRRELRFDGQLGELPTMPGFYCSGSRFGLFHTI
jgi:hypothetical protein